MSGSPFPRVPMAAIGIALGGLALGSALSACTPPNLDDVVTTPVETAVDVSATPAAELGGATTVTTDTTSIGSPVASGAIAIQVEEGGDLGAHLTDGAGRTVYMYLNDTAGESTCSGGCAETWPPVLTDETPLPGAGADPNLVGIAVRADGQIQVTYNDHPLYYYGDDTTPGDTNGHDIGDMWYAVSPVGEKVSEE